MIMIQLQKIEEPHEEGVFKSPNPIVRDVK